MSQQLSRRQANPDLRLSGDRPKFQQPGWSECWADLPEGRMRYLKAGSGRPLVLVHGLMGYAFSWRFTIPALAQHATIYAIDNLGAGLSPCAPGMDCSMRATACRVLTFADTLRLEEFDLLGTSHGGAVAMLAAAILKGQDDQRLKRLILVAPVNPWSAHGKRLAPIIGSQLGSVLFRSTVARWRGFDSFWLRRLFGNGSRIPSDSLSGYRIPVLKNHGFDHGVRIVQTWTKDLRDLEQSIPMIQDYPTLLVWGNRDRAVSVHSAQMLSQCFRKCKVVIFDGVGHLPYEETPEEFNQSLVEFLRSDI